MAIGTGAALAGAGVLSNIFGGMAGQQAGAGDIGAGKAAINYAFQQLKNVGLPPDEAKAIVYQQFQQKGLLTPELEKHIDLQASQMAGVTGSPEAQKAQNEALRILQQRGTTGLTPEDRAALNQIRNQVAADTEAKRQQIMQNFAMRGQAGGGAELIAALQGSQAGANAEAQAGDRLAAMASQNALQAIGQAGTLGGQIEQQRFGEAAEKARAQDIINQFNIQNQLGQQARNVAAQNVAQQYNLGVGQQLANANVQQANQELLRQSQAQRQQYLDTLGRAQAINQAAQGYAGAMGQYGRQEAQSAAAPYQAVGAGLTTIGTNLMKPGPAKFNTQTGQALYDPQTGEQYQNQWKGGEIEHYDEGGNVEDKSLADKLRSYLGVKDDSNDPFQKLAKSGISPSDLAAGAQSSGLAQGGQVLEPHLQRLKKIFPSVSEANLRAIHAKANPTLLPKMSTNIPSSLNMMIPAPQPRSEGGDISNHYKYSQYTDYRQGGHVPGQAMVPGDSPKNDTIPAMLSPGEYVVKRSQAKSPFGKKLIKLLEAHSEVMKHAPKDESDE